SHRSFSRPDWQCEMSGVHPKSAATSARTGRRDKVCGARSCEIEIIVIPSEVEGSLCETIKGTSRDQGGLRLGVAADQIVPFAMLVIPSASEISRNLARLHKLTCLTALVGEVPRRL